MVASPTWKSVRGRFEQRGAHPRPSGPLLCLPVSTQPMKSPLPLLVLALVASTAAGQATPARASSSPIDWPPRLTRDMDLQVQLACQETDGCPHATYVQAFLEGGPVQIAIDTTRLPELGGLTVDLYVTEHRTPAEWELDPVLLDRSGGIETVTPGGPLTNNVFVVDAGTLSGSSGTTEVGVDYSIVIDRNRDGLLDGGDLVDGWGETPGFQVFGNLTLPGPYQPVSTLFNGGSFRNQKIYYPEEVATLGELPLVVVSHGNGHNYQWYDHIGNFLASWGYVVMAHQNNTGPGIETAATSTLRNTNLFLGRLHEIAGGALQGHVDKRTIVWMGHSRGGEGVARAYKRLVEGDPIAQRFTAEDVKLVSSIAPTDFLGPEESNPLDVRFHLWTGGADADVNGCASSDIAQTFHLHERAQGERMSISLHGVGHGDFHDGGGSSVASGPCLVGRERTHLVMKSYLLALLEYVLRGDEGCKEFLWRQWEDLTPVGAPLSNCVVVDLMYQSAPGAQKLVLDDFESNPELDRSSSGGRVVGTVVGRSEGRLDDGNNTFTPNAADVFNGMTLAGALDQTHGTIFSWNEEAYLVFEIPAGKQDVSGYRYLSFRACQTTRFPNTTAELDDLDFSVVVTDTSGRRGAIRIGAYGGGIEEPYQRSLCGGGGKGWANEWETVRIPVDDFRSSGTGVDTSALVGVSFRFGGAAGSDFGRIGLDEIEFTVE